ncbi:type I-F CRISPR-associated protein Csy1 [Erwinia sorbitola]|uniref:Type I-F CRISPR-associated protein Csy1 n=1 Tax=Erwinia sorbitola TaxID=2681984 RepID=A0A6I6ERK4_9GAMM|nr:type I-F CRISPR-associated protein Csy1 [Erwinia sorbitola]QGU88876.1 type I-F CRISPR-associated protein Csy1 [Erwinia sorbitola]
MLRETLTDFITTYIEDRKNEKMDPILKSAEKKLAGIVAQDELHQTRIELNKKHAKLESSYEITAWLTDASIRSKQIYQVTHALKFTHSHAKGSSVYSRVKPAKNSYLTTQSLSKPVFDFVGNAAIFDVAKLLHTEVEGDSLIASLHRGDVSALEPFTNDRQLLDSWVNSFKQVLIDREPASHKLAKQLYFPIGKSQYHLLSPLFSSSLYHALHQRITAARFSEEAKAARSAMREGRWHSDPVTFYPATAVMGIGGKQPQNISYLNHSVHGGKVWLLSCASPSWKSISTPPFRHKTIFNFNIEFARQARPVIARLKRFLYSVKSLENTAEIRQQRLAFTDEIIDILFNYVLGIQNQTENRCWSTQENCQLKRAQQLWLDPYRSQTDKDFRFEREGGDWKKEVARDFGHWMISQIQDEHLRLGAVERREFSTAPLFKQRLRELEQDLQEELS